MTFSDAADVVAVLTDSRGFDTYYLNDQYEAWYGADKVFASVLGRRLSTESVRPLSTVHIPDHFRSGTIENNLLRLGLCDPVYVVLCDGIWETLLNREHLVDYFAQQIRDASLSDDEPLRLEVSHDAITRLFLADDLPMSPARYAERIGRMVSFFARRRRKICWLSLLVPSRSHKDGIHYAGDYKCSPEWQRCLNAVNQRVGEVLETWGESYVDLQALMDEAGGEAACLLDQWHFTEAFHTRVADQLFDLISRDLGATPRLPPDHVSRKFIIPGKGGDATLAVIGEGADEWCRGASSQYKARPASLDTVADVGAEVILVVEPVERRDSTARHLLGACSQDTIVIYPEEIGGIDNPLHARPRGGER